MLALRGRAVRCDRATLSLRANGYHLMRQSELVCPRRLATVPPLRGYVQCRVRRKRVYPLQVGRKLLDRNAYEFER